MNLFESLKGAFRNVLANKTRALLTMLGIIIGVGSVIIISSIGAGSQAQITDQFSQMGVGRLIVNMRGGRNISQSDMLTSKDYELLSAYDQVKYIAAISNQSAMLKLLDPRETRTASLTAVSGDYQDIQSPTLLYGRYINENDNDFASKVAVINDSTAIKVFGYCAPNLVGEKISLRTNRGSQKYTVVGIMENANAEMENMFGDQFPESLVMPLTTVQRLFSTNQISQIMIVVKDENIINEAAEKITAMLDEFHGTTEKYYVQNTMQMMEQINTIMGTVTTMISSIAGISLLVGGIGVMNIMLVTVTERTREIGIRKSIGAKNSDIRVQFLIEAVILTGIGGMLGLGLGYAGGKFAGSLMNITPIISATSVLIAVGISGFIGIVFGVYPANKAAKLDPIEALRYE